MNSRTMVRGLSIRPEPVSAVEVAHGRFGGWLDAQGRFYAAAYQQHIRVAERLRNTGAGPEEPWRLEQSSWILIKDYGEVFALPGRITQRQYDFLGDVLIHAPNGPYRSYFLDSLRTLQNMEYGMP